MELSFVNTFRKIMDQHKLVMMYDGEFNQDIVRNVLSVTEGNLKAEGVDDGVMKKLYNVMVESIQNICKHQHVAGYERMASSFMVGEDDKDFIVISSNPILNSDVEKLKNRIDHINAQDKEGLKKIYKEARLASTISEVGGAGLGFIDMARKSGHKLNYSFNEFQPNISYFTLMCKISKEPNNE